MRLLHPLTPAPANSTPFFPLLHSPPFLLSPLLSLIPPYLLLIYSSPQKYISEVDSLSLRCSRSSLALATPHPSLRPHPTPLPPPPAPLTKFSGAPVNLKPGEDDLFDFLVDPDAEHEKTGAGFKWKKKTD